jgi:AraC-like DNA-binding protein
MKQRLILYSRELKNCPYYSRIFNSEYEIITAKSEGDFYKNIYNKPIDAAVVCFCSAQENDIDNLLRIDAMTGPVAVVACSKILNPEFVRKAAQRGIARFFLCGMQTDKIRDIINDATLNTGLREYFKSHWSGCLDSSPHISRLIEEIIHVFPRRMKVNELAERLGIDRGWLHKICKHTFGRPPTTLMRHLWVQQALYMMRHTNLNNIDIALQLNYTEESSMAREFRKELGYSPNTARRQLAKYTADELLR